MKTQTIALVCACLIGFLFACNTRTASKKLDEKCSLEPDPGMCKAAMPRYYYDKETKKCTQFVWGGCGGVVPFETLAECQTACGR